MSGSAIAFAAVPLARSGEGSKSGPIGLAIILLLCVACYFLFKSMSGHLSRVREDFPAGAAGSPGTAAPEPKPTDATSDVLDTGVTPTEVPASDAQPVVTHVAAADERVEPAESTERPGTD